ncbi:MAG: Gldg family protein, partial [Myxococcota bacterium]
MAMIERWAWTIGLAAATLGLGALLGFAMEGQSSLAARNLALGAVGLALAFALVRRDALRAWFALASTTRSLADGLATALAFALAVGLVALAGRVEQTVDLTSDGRNTLSNQGIGVLEALPLPVNATAFATSLSAGRDEVTTLLERAREHTTQLTIELVDPIAAPARARAAGITGEQTVVLLQAPGRPPVRIDGLLTEDDLIRGLVEATSEVLHRVCWTVDHGEADPDDESSLTGLGGVRTALESLNYQVTLTRLVAEGIDRNCEIVVVARPVLEMSVAAIAALDRYVLAGGQLFVMLEPGQSDALSRWLLRYGLLAIPTPLADPRASYRVAGSDASALWLPKEIPHPVTADLAGFAFIGARPVNPDYDADGIEVEGLVWTSEEAYLDGPGRGEMPGPFSVVAVARVDEPRKVGPLTPDAPPPVLRAGGRLVVVGDA